MVLIHLVNSEDPSNEILANLRYFKFYSLLLVGLQILFLVISILYLMIMEDGMV